MLGEPRPTVRPRPYCALFLERCEQETQLLTPKRITAVLLLLLLAIACGGCGGGGEDGGSAVERINGVPVPPAPDPDANDETVAGIDSDGDGVRDDVQRFIAQEFGSDPDAHALAIEFAKTQQAALKEPTAETVSEHTLLVGCLNDPDVLVRLRFATNETLNTVDRRNAYADAFAGAVLSRDGCPE